MGADRQHLDTLREVLASVCADFGAELVEMDGEDDHVQLLVAHPPHVAVARLVNSSRASRRGGCANASRSAPTGSICGRRRTSRPQLPAWDFYELRPTWNQAKGEVAPWWRCSSKEVCTAGIADLVKALIKSKPDQGTVADRSIFLAASASVTSRRL